VRERERMVEVKKEAKLAAKQERALAKQEKALARAEKQRARTLAAQAPAELLPQQPAELLPPQPAASPFEAGAQPAASPQPIVAAPQQIVNVVVNQPIESHSNTVPVLLNFFLLPGLGQLVQGRVLAGLFWMFCWVVSFVLIFVLIGIVLAPLVWILAIVDAALYRG
jgi:TM2 domain-containing membrane protein YozV